MIAILKKEINSFFSSPIGYLVIAIFLVMNGLFLWVFEGEFNILDAGFADLSAFFKLAPWVLIFLVPAVGMRSFSDEKKQGTLELLLAKPIGHLQIVLGKYLGALILIVIALLPSLLYVVTVWQLGNPLGNLDIGSTLGSYLGLLFLIGSYTSIGIFSSTLSENQIVSFIIAVFGSFFFYFGFEGIASYSLLGNMDLLVQNTGMYSHYKSMGRGVLDTRDILYFICVTAIFLGLTVWRFKQKPYIKPFIFYLFLLFGLYFLGSNFYQRFDLTQDKRYTISPEALKTVDAITVPVMVDVLLEGDFPAGFRRLQAETRRILEEYADYNSNIKFSFIDPFEDEGNIDAITGQLVEMGLSPANVTVNENGKTSQELIVPWAIANHKQRTVRIPLLKNKLGADQEERISNSIQQLEYAFADGFGKLVNPKKRKIAVLRGNGELEDRYMADFLTTLKDYYYIAPFDLDSLNDQPEKILQNLNRFDLVIVAKPTEAFSEKEKLVLDQFTMKGGSSLWLLDAVNMEQDSLVQSGNALAFPRELNLTDMLFKYGVRINPVLVKDLYSAPITLATGQGSNAQFVPVKWFYSPLASAANNHPISNNINLVKFDFANQLDTLKNGIEKTVLLQSSSLSKLEGTPRNISLDIVEQEPDVASYGQKHLPLAVLLEGAFTSAYQNRVKPFKTDTLIEKGTTAKMIVVSDGDIIKNQLQQGRPLELGFDKWTGQQYGNKEFLLNAVNYLLDDDGLINIRSKEIKLAFLDQQKVSEQRVYWQILNLLAPLVLLAIFGLAFNYFRRRKYGQKC